MSQQYDNTNRFVLFPNKRKETSKHPDLTGTINVDGREHFFDAWITWDGPDVSRINGKIGQAKTGSKGGGNGGQRSAPRQRQELGSDTRRQVRHEDPMTDDDIPW